MSEVEIRFLAACLMAPLTGSLFTGRLVRTSSSLPDTTVTSDSPGAIDEEPSSARRGRKHGASAP